MASPIQSGTQTVDNTHFGVIWRVGHLGGVVGDRSLPLLSPQQQP
jgi:hypothetical protein